MAKQKCSSSYLCNCDKPWSGKYCERQTEIPTGIQAAAASSNNIGYQGYGMTRLRIYNYLYYWGTAGGILAEK